ncbi:unnamed protein product [Prorocentrum cordatum]|uniref:Uncharacterized protein n=1 Tax=Prorocentrum cordatum TaxID=2364126 RepID=A0ABN9XZ91_9DINO|nr:unnamed protein product [Polarella glacialis]
MPGGEPPPKKARSAMGPPPPPPKPRPTKRAPAGSKAKSPAPGTPAAASAASAATSAAGSVVGVIPAKRAPMRKEPVGDSCQCGLCKAMAKDIGRQDGKPWALRKLQKKTAGTMEVAMGNKCEECFSLWVDAFSHLEWGDLCELSQGDEEIKQSVITARKVFNEHEPPPKPVQEVAERTEHTIESRRSYIVLTESDLRKALGARRITKAATSSLYTAEVPKEDEDGWEMAYWFVNPMVPYRTVDVASRTGVSRDHFVMDRTKQLWPNQGPVMSTHRTQLMHNEKGIMNIITKDNMGYLWKLEDFLQSRLGENTEGGTEGSGVAGSASCVGGSPRESVSQFGGGMSEDGGAASTAGYMEAGSAGSNTVEYWKSKIDLSLVMDGQVDGRTISACKKAAGRKMAADDEAARLDAQLLNNFIKLILMAQALQPATIQGIEKSELAIYLGKMKDEKVKFPLGTSEKLLHMKIADQQQLGNMIGLFDALDPFTTSELASGFDPENPRLSDIELPMGAKTRLLVHISVDAMLLPMLAKGMDSRAQVETYLKFCIDRSKDVDILELDANAGACISECLDAWQAVYALVRLDLDPELEECVQRLKAAIGKTTRSPLTVVAAAVDSDTWYSQMLSDYIEYAPGLLKYHARVAELSSWADTFEAGADTYDTLAEHIKEVSIMKAQLRPQSVNFLDGKMAAALAAQHARVAASVAGPDTMQRWSAVLAEASALLPHDRQVDEWKTQSAASLAKFDQASKIEAICMLCEVVLDVATRGPQASTLELVASKIQPLFNAVSGAFIECSALKDAEIATISECTMALSESVAYEMTMANVGLLNMAGALHVLDLASKLTQLLGDRASQTFYVAHLQKTINMLDAWGMMTPLADMRAKDELVEGISAFAEFPAKLEALTQTASELAELSLTMPPAASYTADRIKAFYAESSDRLRSILSANLAGTTAGLVKVATCLADMAKGTQLGDGDQTIPRQETFTGKSWDEFLAHAEVTLLTLNPKALESCIDETKKALQMYLAAAAVGGGEPDAQLVGKVQNTILNGHITKLSGILCHKVKTIADLGPLRDAVQSEMLHFRRETGMKTEKELLHPVLLARAMQALKKT